MTQDQALATPPWMDDVLGTHDATALAKQAARGEVSARALAEAAIARAQVLNPRLNAIAATDYERALANAHRKRDGVFAGIPTFIKDTDEVAGLPCTMGSQSMPDTPQTKNSAFVDQFLSMGINILGISTMPEFGFTATTESRRYGSTRNPWNLAYSTGGSSGGAAALVAAGVVPIAHANDGGGSIRIPASCCGLVGLKPTQGRLHTAPLPPLFPVNFVHQGVVTRSVRDTAAFLFGAEHDHKPRKLPAIGHVTGPNRKRLRIGVYIENSRRVHCDSQCAKATEDAATLCRRLGHDVREIDWPFPTDFVDAFWHLWATIPFGLWHGGRRLIGDGFDREGLEPWAQFLRHLFKKNALGTLHIFARLKRFGKLYAAAFGDFDVLLSPTLNTPPPKIGVLGPEVPAEVHFERISNFASFTPLHNIAGAPAISLPLGTSIEGLPIGVMFAARHGDDKTLLELAYELESAAPWPHLATPLFNERALNTAPTRPPETHQCP